MGVNSSKLGYFGLLPPDLRKPGFIRRYLNGSDFKLLLAVYKVNMIGYKDVLYYEKQYTQSNLDLYKYYNIQEFILERYIEEVEWSVIKFYHINGAKLKDSIVFEYMHLMDAVVYLYENKYPFSRDLLNASAMSDDIKVVEYLYNKGYRYDRTSFIEMLNERQCRAEYNNSQSEPYLHFPIIKFLFSCVKLSSYDSIFTLALVYCDYFIIKYMLDNGFVKLEPEHWLILSANTHDSGKYHCKYLRLYYEIEIFTIRELLFIKDRD